ncbi:hypothetical protein OROMI_021939 [Orobanche minor]
MGIPNSPVVSKRKIDDVSTILDLVDGPSKKAHHPCRCGDPKCCGGPNEHIPRVDFEKDFGTILMRSCSRKLMGNGR